MGVAQTESTPAPVAEVSAKNHSFKDWLNGFKAKFQKRKESSNGVVSPLDPPVETVSTSTVTVTAPESQPYKSKLDQKREAENLTVAPRVFFHTTPIERVPSIVKHGLFGDKRDPNASENLGYSLYFGFEHTHLRDRNDDSRKDPLQETPDTYVLTVWKGDNVLKKAPQDSFRRSGYRVIAGKGSSGEVPDSFYEASPMGMYLQQQPGEIGSLSKDNLLSAIPLTRPVREEMVKLLILVEAGVLEADKIESQIQELLKVSDVKVKGVDYVEMAHLLTASMERSLIAAIVKPAFEKAKKSPKIKQMTGLVTQPDYAYGEPLKALWKAYVYRLNVNDKLSARYLDGAIKQLTQIVQSQGIDTKQLFERFDQNIEQIKQGRVYDLRKEGYQLMDFADGGSYYFGAITIDAAYLMLKNQQLGEFNFVKDL